MDVTGTSTESLILAPQMTMNGELRSENRFSCRLSFAGRSLLERLQSGREMPQERRFVGELQALNPLAVLAHFQDHLYDVVDMALRVDPARDCQSDQIHCRRCSEHQ